MQFRPQRNFVSRWQRLLSLDATVLREVYQDAAGTPLAIGTALAVFFLSGLGGWIWWWIEDRPGKIDLFLDSVLLGTLLATGMFLVWAGMVVVVSGRAGVGATGAPEAIVRTLCYATVPFAVSFLIFIPGLAFVITLIAAGLLLISTSLAVQAALNVPLQRAVGLNLFGFFLWAAVLSAVTDLDTQLAPGIFYWARFNL